MSVGRDSFFQQSLTEKKNIHTLKVIAEQAF